MSPVSNANPLVWNLAVQGGFGPGSSQDYRICTRDLWINGTYVGRHSGRFIGAPPQTNGTWCVVTWGGQVYYEDVDWSILIYNKLDLIQ